MKEKQKKLEKIYVNLILYTFFFYVKIIIKKDFVFFNSKKQQIHLNYDGLN